VAVVLTYDAPDHAVTCLASLAAQTLKPIRVIVVENPGLRRVVGADLERVAAFPVELLVMPENIGPAGGYAEGLERAARVDGDAIWVMDDDVAPRADCLAHLVDTWEAGGRREVVVPMSVDAANGDVSSTWGWQGVLMSRFVVDEVGVPLAALFYGFEDQEYLIDRVQNAGHALVRDRTAEVELARRADLRRPVWHYYYMPRNAIYVYTRRRSHIPRGQRAKRLSWFLYRFSRRIFTVEGDRRLKRVALVGRGVVDGLLGRLGRRVPTSDAGRPPPRPNGIG
jgi:GT2 family glycosyltransferase